mmetsp:Transcript_8613/g.17828  ORF Transcript_8613/g.17828 Transcript_8613/m.17828 type:complete len:93 (-) Transcript_8613:429-707(-)
MGMSVVMPVMYVTTMVVPVRVEEGENEWNKGCRCNGNHLMHGNLVVMTAGLFLRPFQGFGKDVNAGRVEKGPPREQQAECYTLRCSESRHGT